MKFQESSIDWDFDETFWSLLQLDRHPHSKVIQLRTKAKQQGERDLKTVDLIGTCEDEEVYFIEIKNYLGNKLEDSSIDVLIHELVLKVRDSFSVILSGSRASDDDKQLLKRISVLLKDEARFTICFWIENMVYKNKQQTELKLNIMQQQLKSKLYAWTNSRVVITNSTDLNWEKVLPHLQIALY